ncbi:MAG: arginine--tRNA ligase [Chlorobia bacterium]|nr:arginine--tRNA ligase [Fimbriimonadaceae bacterium]
MIRVSLQQIVASAVANLVQSGQLPEAVSEVRIEISDTKQPEHGDYACNFALVASKPAGMNPRQLGEVLAQEIRSSGNQIITEVELAGPGFLNLRLSPGWLASFVPRVLEATDRFGQTPPTANRHPLAINVEFVSVNPNGPITIGSGRGAAYGSTLCNVLEAAGNKVHREYYINDGVNSEQMRVFAESVRAFAFGLALPEGGYRGDYVASVAANAERDQEAWLSAIQHVAQQHGTTATYLTKRINAAVKRRKLLSERLRTTTDRFKGIEDIASLGVKVLAQTLKRVQTLQKQLSEVDSSFEELKRRSIKLGKELNQFQESLDRIRASESDARTVFKIVGKNAIHLPIVAFQIIAQAKMLEKQAKDLTAFGVTFNTWFSEQSLHDSGVVAAEIEQMVASQVADDEPVRYVLKLAKGGVIEDVELQPQTGKAEVDEDEHGDGPAEEKGSGGAEEESSNPATEQSSNSKTLWLRSAKFGDDMDRVLKRRDGRLTYIASDVAYHKDKLTDASGTRGTGPVDKMITVLGPDHHGYIGRLQAVVAAMLKAEGLVGKGEGVKGKEQNPPITPDPLPLTEIDAKIYSTPEERDLCRAALAEAKEKLEVQIFQLVRFVKDGKPAPMRKRDGNIYALIDLMKEIGENVKPNGTEEEKLEAGKDVARFFYLMRSHDTTFDFDLDLAQKQSDENPVFYVQYAHARICSVISRAVGVFGKEEGVKGKEQPNEEPDHSHTPYSLPLTDFSLLSHDKELSLIKKICDLPFEVQRCAEDYGVHRLTTFAIELARTYHHFYDACRVIQPDQPELSSARLALCEATRLALKGTLDLLGISAPERMDRAEPAV